MKFTLVFSEVTAHIFEIEADNIDNAEQIARQSEPDYSKQISYDLVDSETETLNEGLENDKTDNCPSPV